MAAWVPCLAVLLASWGLGEGAPLTRWPCPAPATAGAGHGQERYEPAPTRVHGDVQHEAGLGRADGDLPPAHHPVWRPVRASPSVGRCPPSSTHPSKGCLQRGRGGPEALGRQAQKTLCSDSVTSGCRLSIGSHLGCVAQPDSLFSLSSWMPIRGWAAETSQCHLPWWFPWLEGAKNWNRRVVGADVYVRQDHGSCI